jgi:hypothetical protein
MAVRRKIQRIGDGYKPPESQQFTRLVQPRSAVTVTNELLRRISRGQPVEDASSSPRKEVEPREITVPERDFSLHRFERSSLVVKTAWGVPAGWLLRALIGALYMSCGRLLLRASVHVLRASVGQNAHRILLEMLGQEFPSRLRVPQGIVEA